MSNENSSNFAANGLIVRFLSGHEDSRILYFLKGIGPLDKEELNGREAALALFLFGLLAAIPGVNVLVWNAMGAYEEESLSSRVQHSYQALKRDIQVGFAIAYIGIRALILNSKVKEELFNGFHGFRDFA
jgi:hypothetical protein